MKIFRLWLFLGLSLLILVSCSKIEEDPFPSMQEITGTKAGDITWETGVINIKEKEYRAEFGILNVSENREKADSRPIHLPVAGFMPQERISLNLFSYLQEGPGRQIFGNPLQSGFWRIMMS
jgi:hypothetical protein